MYTLPIQKFLRQFRGGQLEIVIKLEKILRGGGKNSLAPHVICNRIHPLLELSIGFTVFVHAPQKQEEKQKA